MRPAFERHSPLAPEAVRAQWMLRSPPWALLGLPTAAALAGGVYLTSQLGQSLSQRQMRCLSDFVDRALELS